MNHRELTDLLATEGFVESASELHGLLCGRLACGETLDGPRLQLALEESLESEEDVIEQTLPILKSLYEMTLAALRDSAFAFKPLLPGDEKGLEERVGALADWAQGFIMGLGDAGLSADTPMSEEANDALQDLAAIAQAEYDGEDDDSDEADFMELEEYVRVAAILLFTELGDKLPIVAGTSRTLH